VHEDLAGNVTAGQGPQARYFASWCVIEVRICCPGSAAWWSSAGDAAAVDQPGDRRGDLGEVVAASEVALRRPPLLVLGDGVLDADAPG
jgi:hypothetical protein